MAATTPIRARMTWMPMPRNRKLRRPTADSRQAPYPAPRSRRFDGIRLRNGRPPTTTAAIMRAPIRARRHGGKDTGEARLAGTALALSAPAAALFAVRAAVRDADSRLHARRHAARTRPVALVRHRHIDIPRLHRHDVRARKNAIHARPRAHARRGLLEFSALQCGGGGDRAGGAGR